jgi:hypothetical protein
MVVQYRDHDHDEAATGRGPSELAPRLVPGVLDVVLDQHERIVQHTGGLFERDAVLPLVLAILGFVPVDIGPLRPR